MLPHRRFQRYLESTKPKDVGLILNRLQMPYVPEENKSFVPVDEAFIDWANDKNAGLDIVFRYIVLNYEIRNIVDTLLIKERSFKEIRTAVLTSKKENLSESTIQLYYTLLWNVLDTTPNDWTLYITYCELQGLRKEAKNKTSAVTKPFSDLQWDLGILQDVGVKDFLNSIIFAGSNALFSLLSDPEHLSTSEKMELVKHAIKATDLRSRVDRDENAETNQSAVTQLKLELDIVKDRNEMSLSEFKALIGDKVKPTSRSIKEIL